MGNSNLKSADRKAQIINATLFVIGENGLQGLTTAKIAAKSGITEAALYRHFNSKEDILVNAIDSIGMRLTQTLKTIVTEKINCTEKLSKIFLTHLDHIQKNRGIPRIIYTSEVHLDKVMRNKLYSIIESYLKIIANILNEGITNGEFKPDMDIASEAMLYLAMIQFTAFRYSLSGFKKNPVEEGLLLWNSFVKSLS